jgi:xanthine dehydrogenase iron-sulfur cluster and FAD-binding subunit A
MGKETTSPQGYMQSVRLMAGDRIDNVLLASSTQNQDQMLKAAQFEHGRRVLDSMPAYEVLEKQIKGQPWEDKLISRSGLETINEAKSKLQNMKSNEEYRDAALSLTTELGKKSIEVELSSPSPY